MRTARIFFYVIYVASIIAVLLISINLYDALDVFRDWGWYKYFSDLPVLGRKLLYILCFLMTAEIIVENVYFAQERKKLKEAQQEIKKLEGLLYDKAQEELTEDGFVELKWDDLTG